MWLPILYRCSIYARRQMFTSSVVSNYPTLQKYSDKKLLNGMLRFGRYRGLHPGKSCLTRLKFLLSILYVIVAVSLHSKALVYLIGSTLPTLPELYNIIFTFILSVNATSLTFLNAMATFEVCPTPSVSLNLYRMFGAVRLRELHRKYPPVPQLVGVGLYCLHYAYGVW